MKSELQVAENKLLLTNAGSPQSDRSKNKGQEELKYNGTRKSSSYVYSIMLKLLSQLLNAVKELPV